MQNFEKIKNRLSEIVGKENVKFDDETKEAYSHDMTAIEPHKPDFVVFADKVEQIIDIVKLANEEKIPIIPMVAGTNLGGLTIPTEGGIILDLKRMNRIIELNEDEMYMVIEPGVTFGDIKNYLDKRQSNLRFGYPLSPPYVSVVCNCLLDGLGNLSNRYGSMSNWLNGLEVVLPDGKLMRCGSRAVSNYWTSRGPLPDLMGLFISWQGTTGIVTKAAVQLFPKSKYTKRYFVPFYELAATYHLLRKLARTLLFDDLAALSYPAAKMLLGVEKPRLKDENEPEFFLYVDLSADTTTELKLKEKVIDDSIRELKNKVIQAKLDVDTLVTLMPKFSQFASFPMELKFLLEHSGGGLTWLGTYGPCSNWEEGIRRGFNIMQRYHFPPLVVTRPMHYGHFAVLRFIITFNKKDEEEITRVKNTLEELCEATIELGFIPYKIPIWAMKKIINRLDSNYYAVLKLIKHTLDPNRIMNPGKLLF